jgi:hypothetical protein
MSRASTPARHGGVGQHDIDGHDGHADADVGSAYERLL